MRIVSHACSAVFSNGRPSATPPRATPLTLRRCSTESGCLSVTPLTTVPRFSTFGPSAVIIAAIVAVVALHDREVRHRLAGDRLALPRAPVQHAAARLADLGRGVVGQRRGDDVGLGAEARPGHLAEDLGEAGERVVVAARLPRRCDRGVERVDVGVHVGGGDVVLLVPRRRRQQHVAEQARARHPEVQRHQQVELADRAPPRATSRPSGAGPRASPRRRSHRRRRAGGAGSTRCPCPTSRAGSPATR